MSVLTMSRPEQEQSLHLPEPSETCLRLLAEQVPLSLLIDLALPTRHALGEEPRDESGDTSWLEP